MEPPEIYLIDSSALYALIAVDDIFHHSAIESFRELRERNSEIWTTSYALSETVGLVHRRLGFDAILELLNSVEPIVDIYWVDEEAHSAAMAEYKAAEGRGLSLVDWTIVVVSRMMSARVFTFDAGMARQVIDAIPRQ